MDRQEITYLNFKISKQLIMEWLTILAKRSDHCSNFLDAIVMARFEPITEKEQEIIATLHNLYLAEISGKIIPPIKLEELYKSAIEESNV